ncbi:MAG TPA: hypothetical protein VJ649_02805, partial [Actinomycetes bacterium]|nr:hypothetical protein [Actinomycetes bacterium]
AAASRAGLSSGDGRRPTVAHLLQTLSQHPTVEMRVDGQVLVGEFEPNRDEIRRRAMVGAGAVTSTALLHGLWLLPAGGIVRADDVPPVKQQRLMAAPTYVELDREGFRRTYEPAGAVHAVYFPAQRIRPALERAVRFSPIFRRYVVVDRPPLGRTTTPLIDDCARAGLGLVELHHDALELLVPPPAPVRGVPAVYRWWIAELAYAGWLARAMPTRSAEASAPRGP